MTEGYTGPGGHPGAGRHAAGGPQHAQGAPEQPYAPQQSYAPQQGAVAPEQAYLPEQPYAPGQAHASEQPYAAHAGYGTDAGQVPGVGQPYQKQPYQGRPYPGQPQQRPYPGFQEPDGYGQDAPGQPYPAAAFEQASYEQPPYDRPAFDAPGAAPQTYVPPVGDAPTMALPRQAPVPQTGAFPQPPYGGPGMPVTPVPAAAAPAAPAPAARTGSPIIDPGLQPALITAGAAALLAGGAAVGKPALALVVGLLQALTAAGWFRLNGMWPARQGIALAALAGLTADVAVLLAGGSGNAAAVAGTLGGFFLLVLVLQTFRPSDPAERFYALTVLGSATVVTVFCTALLLADRVPAAVGAVALATLLAAAPLPGPRQLGPVLGLVAAVVFGLVVGAPPALGLLAGLGALVGRRVAAYDFPSRFVHMTAGVALPLAVAAPLVWIGTALLAG
ncbi:hypothetical protein ACWEQL_18080 [Kitasatospora sp. NPDC004240]